MKNFTILTILISLIIMNSPKAQTAKLHIIPSPQKVEMDEGFFNLPASLKIYLKDGKSDVSYAADQLKESFETNLNLNCEIVNNGKAANGISLMLAAPEDLVAIPDNHKDEGYVLVVNNNGVTITASTPKGIYYGAMSLIQMAENSGSKSIQNCKITDWPDMNVRGISDDISRGQVSTLANFKRIIKFIARYKMNTYMPYLEDMLHFDQYPSIGKNRGALTDEEVHQLVAYAKKHFVEIIPIFQTLGHYENILTQEKFVKYAEFPGAASLNVSNDSVYVFLESLLKKVFKLFPSEYFHMGADESFDVGLGASKYLVDQSSIAKVHADHYKKIYDICKKYGKKVMMYGDIILRHPDILSMLPKDIIIVDWHYRASYNYPSTVTFSKAGFKYYVSPAVWNFTSTFPVNLNALPNIEYIIKDGLENGSTGMINSNWGDYGAETFKEFVLYGYAWSAQCSWSFKKSNLSDFSGKFFNDFFGIQDSRLPEIYETLSNVQNQITWNDVWHHPLLPFRHNAWWEPGVSPVVKISWMNWTLPQIHKYTDELKAKVKKNKDHLNLLDFIFSINNWYKLKLNTQFILHDMIDSTSTVPGDSVIKLIDDNISSLKELRNNFSNQWLKYYKKDNLNFIQDKFDRLSAYFTEIKDSIENGSKYLYSPLLKSDWIYAENSDSSLADSAEFTAKINLPELPDKALLQLMGDSYAKLYINGKYVTEVFARRTLSLLVDYRRIKFVDIKKYLKEGENTFTVKVKNYSPRGAAGFNIASYFKTGDSVLNIDTHPGVWLGRPSGKTEWENVVTKKYPWLVIAPNFVTGRTSWIER